jgi:hypothetical protein
VTLLVVLVVIGGILSVIGGIALIFLKDNPDVVVETGSSGVGLWAGIGTIIVGLIYLAVAKGLSNGNGLSRLIVAIVSLLSIIGGFWVGITQVGNGALSGWSSVFWGVIILVILYSPKANAFFRTN